MQKLPISLVIITFNEEENIKRCIKSAEFVSEVIVLDSGSVDRTVEIASQLGARVEVQSFKGYRQQKEDATKLAKYDWVLSLDADEAISEPLAEEIHSKFQSVLNSYDGAEIPRLSYYLGKWIRHGGWYPDRQIRLFKKNSSAWVSDHVHERVKVPRSIKFKNSIYHWVFKDIEDQVQTNNEYSSLGAIALHSKGVHFCIYRLLVKPVSKFIETYIWKRGFLDGLPGFIISVSAAYSVFLKYSKLWEMKKGQDKSSS